MKLVAILTCLLALMASPGNTYADAVKIIDFPPAYQPGQTFSFGILLPDTSNLAIYQIDVLLSSVTGTAGTDYFFGSVIPAAPNQKYVFDSNLNFGSGINLESPSTQRLSLSDFDFAGVNTSAGINDHIATINIETATTFTGDLRLSIDSGRLILDGPELTPTPVVEFDAIRIDTGNQPATVISAVPEPGNIAFLFAATCVLVSRRTRRRSGCA